MADGLCASIFGHFECGSAQDGIHSSINSMGRWKRHTEQTDKGSVLFSRLSVRVSLRERVEGHLALHTQNGLDAGASGWRARRGLGHFQSCDLGLSCSFLSAGMQGTH